MNQWGNKTMNMKQQGKKALSTIITAGALMTASTVQAAIVAPILDLNFTPNTIDAGESTALQIQGFSGTFSPVEQIEIEITGFDTDYTVNTGGIGDYNVLTGVYTVVTDPGAFFNETLLLTAPSSNAMDLNLFGTATAVNIFTLEEASTTATERLAIDDPGASAVPVPGAVWLFGSALLGFGALHGRKK